LAQQPRLGAQVFYPERPARSPHFAHETLTALDDQPADAVRRFPGDRVGRVPPDVEAHHGLALIERPVLARVPALGATDLAERGLERLVRVVRAGQDAQDLVVELDQPRAALLPGDVPREAAITAKTS